MVCRLQLRLDAATTCAADLVRGTIIVDISADSPPPSDDCQPTAVRVAVYGEERHSDGITVEHVTLVSTVSGQRAAGEAAQATALLYDATAFTTAQARANPLAGVPMDTYYGNNSSSSGGGGAAGSGWQQHGYLQPSDVAAAGAAVGQEAKALLPPAAQAALSPPPPPPPALSAPAARPATTAVPVVAAPRAWVPGGHYEYPFALQLPPWSPPSYCYEPDGNEADARLRYVVCGFIATAAPDATNGSSSSNSSTDRSTRVLVTKENAEKLAAGRRRGSNNDSRSSRKGSVATACGAREGAGGKDMTVTLDLPTQTKQLLRVLEREQTRELVVLSAFPKREFLQCLERVAIKPRFAHNLVFHLYKQSLSLSLLGIAKIPFTDIDVRITYDSSAAVVLCGRPQSMDHVRAALDGRGDDGGDSGAGGAQTGLTVMGTVVSSTGDPRTAGNGTGDVEDKDGDLGAAKIQQNLQDALEGVLRLRVRVTAGSVSVSKVRVELCERVRLASMPASHPYDTHILAAHVHTKKIRAEETSTFAVRLVLPKAFRRCRQESNKLPPPVGIATPAIRTTTWLNVTFPDLNAVPKSLLEENVVMMAEDVDLSDTVPFLPHFYSTAQRKRSGTSTKLV